MLLGGGPDRHHEEGVGVATRRVYRVAHAATVAEEGAGVTPVPAEVIHVTRRRSGSIARRPRRLSDSPSPPPATSSPHSSAVMLLKSPHRASPAPAQHPPQTISFSLGSLAVTGVTPHRPPTTLATPFSIATPSRPISIKKHPPPLPATTLLSSSAPARSSGVGEGFAPDQYTDGRRHPRDLVPQDVGFPTAAMEGLIDKEDQEDRLLMATCAVLILNENRALCPKEVAEVMFEKGWLHNAGTTPFAHISTSIRSHIRRAAIASPPYPPLFTSFELVGTLTAYEMRAVGLRSEDKPAVKRGTLWYLNERVLGKDMGAEDPFIRCRREAGLGPSEENGVYVRNHLPPPVYMPVPVHDDDDDDSGMGRGKRKRRASSALIAASTPIDPNAPASITTPLTIPAPSHHSTHGTRNNSWQPSHRKATSMTISASAPAKPGFVPKLRLRLTSLEEVDSMDDSDGQNSDAQRRRKNKKKARRAASEGGALSRNNSGDSGDDEDIDDEVERRLSGQPPAFSSASSSALLQQSLLAASAPAGPQVLSSSTPSHAAISPGSLTLASTTTTPFHHHRPSHLSSSAPGLFSSFPSAPSPDTSMELDSHHHRYKVDDIDSADEDDFHEAMLRGEDFDFEWGSESYTTGASMQTFSQSVKSHPKIKSREPSLELPDTFDLKDMDDMDAVSTPATTPRSPPAMRDDDGDIQGCRRGLEATLCEAFAQEVVKQDEEEDDVRAMIDRATSTDSLTSLDHDDEEEEPPATVSRDEVDQITLSVPLPSPLALELPPMLPLVNSFPVDYDFLGHEEDDRSAYRNGYDRDMAESADDEDEEDDIVTVKIEEDGSVGPGSAMSSRHSSVLPMIESFSRRLMSENLSSSSSNASTDSDIYDPHMIVSNSILASGLPIPQVAPSPPETTDWGMHLDLDDMDIELGSGVDLLGPESVGLEELDLAWGGSAEQGDDETHEEWKARTQARSSGRRVDGPGSAFLTGSPVDGSTPIVSPRSSMDAGRPRVLSIPTSTTIAAALVVPTTVTADAPSSRTTPPKAPPYVVVYPKVPLTPTVTATIVPPGVPVYATNVVDAESSATVALLRRIDTDYINGTVLLQAVALDAYEREAVLAEVETTFAVLSGGVRLEGTWIPLPAARSIAAQHSALSHLAAFLDDDLYSRFPEPIPSLRKNYLTALATASSPRGVALGFPAFADAVSSEEPIVTAKVVSPPPVVVVKKSARARTRRMSTASVVKSDTRDSSPEVIKTISTGTVRKSRRSIASK